MTPNGESLKMLARDLGIRVYTKYSVRQKYRNRTVEKLSTIYNAYTEVLAKDTEVLKELKLGFTFQFLMSFQSFLPYALC